LSGEFCAVTDSETLAALHPRFAGMALLLGLRDFDAAALKDGRARKLTQSVATYLYGATDLNGLRFASRHGDDLVLWAVFERPGDPATSPCVVPGGVVAITHDHPDTVAALSALGLSWST
jgi:hypothetical protein